MALWKNKEEYKKWKAERANEKQLSRDVNKDLNNMDPPIEAQRQCPSCKTLINKKASICPHCRKRFGLTWPAKIFLLLIALGFIPFFFHTTSKKPSFKEPSPTAVIDDVALTETGKAIKIDHPNWSNKTCNSVADKNIILGMTPEQAKASWGEPEKINESVGTWGRHEQWVYGHQYVYFENGVLRSWQDFK